MRRNLCVLNVFLAVAAAACGGGDGGAASTTAPGATTATTAATTTSAVTTSTTTTTAPEEELTLGEGDLHALALLASTVGFLDGLGGLVEAHLGGTLSVDELDLAIHDAYRRVGALVGARYTLGSYEPIATLREISSAVAPVHDALDTAVYFWDELWQDEGSGEGYAEDVRAVVDEHLGTLEALLADTVQRLEGLGADPDVVAAVLADPGAFLLEQEPFGDQDVSGAVEIGGWAWRMTDVGLYQHQDFNLVGWITNSGPDAYDNVSFDVEVLDAGGAVLDTGFGVIDLIAFYPGETRLVRTLGWNHSYLERHLDEIAAVTVTPPIASVYDGYSGYFHDFDIVADEIEALGASTIDVTGTITNTGDVMQKQIRVILVGFDASGRVVGYGDGSLGDDGPGGFSWEWDRELQPGESSQFKGSVNLWWPADLDRIEFIAEGTDGTFPW